MEYLFFWEVQQSKKFKLTSFLPTSLTLTLSMTSPWIAKTLQQDYALSLTDTYVKRLKATNFEVNNTYTLTGFKPPNLYISNFPVLASRFNRCVFDIARCTELNVSVHSRRAHCFCSQSLWRFNSYNFITSFHICHCLILEMFRSHKTWSINGLNVPLLAKLESHCV